jgi:hypothetical protein
VQEHGTPAAGDARPHVVVDFDHEIIKMIIAAKPVARLARRTTERAVVAAVARILAPSEVGGDATDRQQGLRARVSVGPPPET